MHDAGRLVAVFYGCPSGLGRWRAADRRWTDLVEPRHACNLLSDAVCVTLKRVVRFADDELGVYRACPGRQWHSRLVRRFSRKYRELTEIPCDAVHFIPGRQALGIRLMVAVELVPGQARIALCRPRTPLPDSISQSCGFVCLRPDDLGSKHGSTLSGRCGQSEKQPSMPSLT